MTLGSLLVLLALILTVVAVGTGRMDFLTAAALVLVELGILVGIVWPTGVFRRRGP